MFNATLTDAVRPYRGLNGTLCPTLQLLLGQCLLAGKRHEEAVAMQGAARAKLRSLPGIDVDISPTARKLLRKN